ncbi:MAG TPA: hypothetical protein VFZ37_10335 [Jiangellaceae bacterium]
MLRGDRNPWWALPYRRWPDHSDAAWITLPGVGEPLDAVIHIGNGKDAKLILVLASGRAIELVTNGVRVEAEGSVEITTTAWGDSMLRIDYQGTDLVLVGGRMSFTGDIDDPWTEMFLRDARAWIESGLKGELLYDVAVELRLGSSASVAAAA